MEFCVVTRGCWVGLQNGGLGRGGVGERAGEDDAGHVRVDAGRVFRLFPSTQRDLNMGFLLILTQAYHHPTGHLLLITQVIGSEAWVEVKPLEQSEMSVYQQDPLHPRRVGNADHQTAPAGLASPQSCSNFPLTHTSIGTSRHRKRGPSQKCVLFPGTGDLGKIGEVTSFASVRWGSL